MIPKRMDADCRGRVSKQSEWLATDRHASLVLNSLKMGVLVSSETGEIFFANRHASEILKRPVEELERSRLDSILFPLEDLLEEHCEMAENLCGKTQRPESDVKLPDGGVVTIGFSISKIAIPEALFRHRQYVVSFQDITRWNVLLKERNRLLQIATVGQILPTILHELKNPLAAITTAVEVLLEEVAQGETQEALHAILSEIRRMTLVFEGIGSTHRSLYSSRYMAVDIAIEEAVFLLKTKAKQVGVVLSSEVCQMPLLPIETTVIRAILFNLISNAVDACRPEDKIFLTARLKNKGTILELIVSDTGCGMSDATRMRCTDLFVTTKPSGSGIGLSMCKNVIDAAGGTFLIESRENEGTKVSVLISTRFPGSQVI